MLIEKNYTTGDTTPAGVEYHFSRRIYKHTTSPRSGGSIFLVMIPGDPGPSVVGWAEKDSRI